MIILKNKKSVTRLVSACSLGILMTVSSLTASATTIIEERFDYGGGTLAGANGGIGWRDSWKSTPHLNADSLADLSTGPLPAPKGYPSAEGKRLALIDPNGQSSAYRGLATNAFIFFDQDRTYYVSFLVRRSHGGYGFALRQGANTTTVGVIVSTGGAITLTLDGHSVTSENVISSETTHLFVLKIQANASGLDRVFLNQYTESETLPAEEPETWLLEAVAETSLFAERVALLGGGNRTIEFDEFRVGTTWTDNVYVTPSSFALSLEQSNDRAIWEQVSFTPDMVSEDGRIIALNMESSPFFRLRIEPKDAFRIGTTSTESAFELTSPHNLTLEQSGDLTTWNQVTITSEMVGPDGYIFPPDVEGKNFFRMRIEAHEE